MRSPFRSVLITTVTTIGASVGAVLIAWISVTALGEASSWYGFSKRFETALTLCRALLYSTLIMGWFASRTRQQNVARRRLRDRTALTGVASILLVELNRIHG